MDDERESPLTVSGQRQYDVPGIASDPYRNVARRLLARTGWSFISEDGLRDCISARSSTTSASVALEQIAYGCAAAALYAACRAVHDPQQIEQGYTELFRYLQRIAALRWPQSAPDIVQRALELTYAQIDRCQAPESFLAFARFKLLQAAKEEHGARVPPASIDETRLKLQLTGPDDVATSVLNAIAIETLLQAIGRLPDPRQRTAVVSKYFRAASDQVIARELGITPQHVAVLRNRALQRLRRDPMLSTSLRYPAENE